MKAKLLAVLIALGIGLAATPLSIAAIYYVHEAGHVLACNTQNLFEAGEYGGCGIAKWAKTPWGVPVPVQAGSIGKAPSLMWIGGSAATVLIALLAALWIHESKLRKKELGWLIPLSVLLFEVYGNFFCGTDNPTLKPLMECAGNPFLEIVPRYALMIIPMAITVIAFHHYKQKLGQKQGTSPPHYAHE